MFLTRIVERLINQRRSARPMNRKRAMHRSGVPALIEPLESRQLLSATIQDNADSEYSDVRTWNTAAGGYLGTVRTAGSEVQGAFASWTFENLPNGQYYIQATWPAAPNHASNATFTVRSEFGSGGIAPSPNSYGFYDGGINPTISGTKVNQQIAPRADFVSGSTAFQTLQVFTVTNGTVTVELTNPNADGLVIADAVRIEKVAATDNSVAVRTERLKQLSLAIHTYMEVYGQFPPDNVPAFLDSNNKPFLSWRVHLLPFLGYGDLFQQFKLNEPWNSPNNLPLLSQMPDVFRSRDLVVGSTSTGFQRIQSNDAYHINGAGGPSAYKMGDWADTILLLETPASNAVAWTAPDDAPYQPTQPLNIVSPAPADFTLVSMWNGQVRHLNPNISAVDFRSLVTWQGGEVISAAREANMFVDPPRDPDLESQTKLTLLHDALLNYHGTYNTFPLRRDWDSRSRFDANGQPFLSWRVYLLPYLGCQSLFVKFHLDEPWNSPNNLPLADLMPEVFRSRGVAPGSNVTSFKILNGPAAFEYGGPTYHYRSLRDVVDGLQNTLAFIELPASQAMTWTRPDSDVAFDLAAPLSGIGTIPAEGLWSILFDGTPRLISPQTTAANFGAIASWLSGEALGPAELSNVFADEPTAESIELRKRKLQEIAGALSGYGNDYAALPIKGSREIYDANGKPHLSWRVYLLPYLGHRALFNQFHLDEPWNSLHNLPLLDKMPEVFRSRGIAHGSHMTGVQLLNGPGAYQQPLPHPIYGYGDGPRFQDVIDNRGNTIFAVETLPELAVEWTRPDGDIAFDLANPLAGLGLAGLENVPADGLLAISFDLTVLNIRPTITAADFRALATWAGREVISASDANRLYFEPPIWWYRATSSPKMNDLRDRRLKIRELIFSLVEYQNGYFPPWTYPAWYDSSGKPKLSWRVHVLPYLDESALYQQFHLDEPWDSPNNLPLLAKMPEVFRSRGLDTGTTKTGFQLISGPQAYDDNLLTFRGKRITEITDGTYQTIGIVETPAELAVDWTKPDDFLFNPADPLGGLASLVNDYLLTAFYDWSDRIIHPQIAPNVAAAFMTWSGGEQTHYFDYGYTGYSSPYQGNGEYGLYSTTPEISVLELQLSAGRTLISRYFNEMNEALFETVDFGATSTKSITVTNTGSQPLVISNVQVPAGFTWVTPLTAIAANSSKVFEIRMEGTVPGENRGVITLTTNVPDQPTLSFLLVGHVNAPHVVVVAETIPVADGTGVVAFGTAALGQPVTKTFTVNNTGELPLIVQPVTVPAGFEVVSNFTANQSIPAGQSATFTVRLVATTKGTFQGAATFGTNDTNHSSFQFTLTGLVESPPTLIELSGTTLPENQPTGTVIGSFSTTDEDVGDTFTYSLVAGTGDADNLLFTIDAAGNLTSASTFNFEARDSYSIRVRTTDAGGLWIEQPFSISITNVNDAPVLGVPGELVYVENDVKKPINTGLTVNDEDSATLASATITITNFVTGQDVLGFVNDGATMGNIAIQSNTGGLLSLTSAGSTATLAQWQTALRAVTYANTSDNPSVTTRNVEFVVDDGAPVEHASLPLATSVSITADNDTPIIGAFDPAISFTENGSPLPLDVDVTVTDVDSANLEAGRLTIRLTANAQLTDRLEIRHQGNGTGQIGVTVSNVTYGGTVIGTFTGGVGSVALEVTLNAAATPVIVQALLRNITFRSLSESPATNPRTVSATLTDGDGGTSNSPAKLISVHSVNDGPVLSGIEGAALSFVENGAAVAITSSVIVSDPDNSHLTGARFRISANYQVGSDVLLFTSTATITGTWTAATGVLVLTGTDTVANYQTAIRSVRYRNTSDDPRTLPRTVLMLVNDGTTNSNVASRTINMTVSNDAPTLTGIETASLAYTENGAATIVSSAITVIDPDNTHLSSARIQITSNYQVGADVLSFTNTTAITGTWFPATGTLVLVGSDTVANYQAALRSVKYRNLSDHPSTLPRTVRMIVRDSQVDSSGANRTIVVHAVNDAPTLTGVSPVPVVYPVGSSAVSVAPGIVIGDLDHATLVGARIKIGTNYQRGADLLAFVNTATWDAATGVLVLTGTDTVANYQAALRNVKYRNTSATPSSLTRTILMLVNDGLTNSNVTSRDIWIT